MAQNLKPNRSDNRGGKRENSGAKPKGNTLYCRRVAPDHVELLDAYLNTLRNG